MRAADRPADIDADADVLPVEAASVSGADELFWLPTLEQAEAMAQENGIPIFVMGYSLVDERSTYTRLSEEYCSAVF